MERHRCDIRRARPGSKKKKKKVKGRGRERGGGGKKCQEQKEKKRRKKFEKKRKFSSLVHNKEKILRSARPRATADFQPRNAFASHACSQ